MNITDTDNIQNSLQKIKSLSDLLPDIQNIINSSETYSDFINLFEKWALEIIKNSAPAMNYQNGNRDIENYYKLRWKDYAAIRIIDYKNHTGKLIPDHSKNNESFDNQPFKLLWMALKYDVFEATEDYYDDMYYLILQLSGKFDRQLPGKSKVEEWMERFPSGLDKAIVLEHQRNRDRIIRIFISKMDKGEISDVRYKFPLNIPFSEKYELMLNWWNDRLFHLKFAIRNPFLLNEMLGYSLSTKTMDTLVRAYNKGIPFFVNPYYLSLIIINPKDKFFNDHSIRDYVLHSDELVEEFGKIVAWEKEDIVKPGEPNAAGWILPSESSLHRRYPDVAIFIPDTTGRACGGLCVSCQRMYDFQRGHLNFNLEKLKPKSNWRDSLISLLSYFENDSQLQDILITGGDALMSSDVSLKIILEEVCNMALRKKESNKNRAEGEKFAEMQRVRIGTRLPVYLPQRINSNLIEVLRDFKHKAEKAGIKQFVIQTHIQSPLEITPESMNALKLLNSTGWIIVNQLVLTTSASRRGHIVKLRKVLNDLGVLTYYTFSIKGFKENSYNFSPNARSVQEMVEEKSIGAIGNEYRNELTQMTDGKKMKEMIDIIREKANIPFIAADKNVMNLPGIGKSMSFRVIGITPDGRRILEFDHDFTRKHSPIISSEDKTIIVESKSISKYLKQLSNIGEDINEYLSVYGYSLGYTERRVPVYEYPKFNFKTTSKYTNFSFPVNFHKKADIHLK